MINVIKFISQVAGNIGNRNIDSKMAICTKIFKSLKIYEFFFSHMFAKDFKVKKSVKKTGIRKLYVSQFERKLFALSGFDESSVSNFPL